MTTASISEMGCVLWRLDTLREEIVSILKNEGIDTYELEKRIEKLKEGAKNGKSRMDKTT